MNRGEITECRKCGTAITLQHGGPPLEALRGWIHTNPDCRRAARQSGRVWVRAKRERAA